MSPPVGGKFLGTLAWLCLHGRGGGTGKRLNEKELKLRKSPVTLFRWTLGAIHT